ncbi:MAG: hypothetical protein GVY13_04485 [Alphaproteobacteria bacterium]|jgi:hypothetical protein|nr:hypothetical protein [Alphaproteobacteria bacterium]
MAAIVDIRSARPPAAPETGGPAGARSEAMARPAGGEDALIIEGLPAADDGMLPAAERGPGGTTTGRRLPDVALPAADADASRAPALQPTGSEGAQPSPVPAAPRLETAPGGGPIEAATPQTAAPAPAALLPAAGDGTVAATLPAAASAAEAVTGGRDGAFALPNRLSFEQVRRLDPADGEDGAAGRAEFQRLDLRFDTAVVDLTVTIATDDLVIRIAVDRPVAIVDAGTEEGFRFAALRPPDARPEVRATPTDDAGEARDLLVAALRVGEAPDRLFRTEEGVVAVRADKPEPGPDSGAEDGPAGDLAILAELFDAPPFADGFWL